MKIAILKCNDTHNTGDDIRSPALGRPARRSSVGWPRPCATLSGVSSRSEL